MKASRGPVAEERIWRKALPVGFAKLQVLASVMCSLKESVAGVYTKAA
jgi:hypothetical protein